MPFSLPDDERRIETSIVVVASDNLEVTRMALETVLGNTSPDARYEVIVVDNASPDELSAYLEELAERNARVRILRNDANLGFAAGTNAGVAAARGPTLVLLNNDTLVAPGWLGALTSHLADDSVGLVGPLTNRAPGPSEIDVDYTTYGGFLNFAGRVAGAERREPRDAEMLPLFCAAVRRDVYEQVGPLDERFGIGMFEDDDYAMRLRAAGYRLVVAGDVFVHHFGQVTLGALAADGAFGRLFEENRSLFEEKWGVTWQPRRRPDSPEYEELGDALRRAVRERVPAGARVFVVSRGDDGLLELPGLAAAHFPQAPGGGYAGHHPADDAAAIAELERVRRNERCFLVIPKTSSWWLSHYGAFGDHLTRRYRRVEVGDDSCVIFDLAGPREEAA